MSTRSQIRILGNKAIIYRHSDGYPGSIEKRQIGVIPDIMPFCLAFMDVRGWDPEYMLANLTAYLKQWHCGELTTKSLGNYHVMEVNGIRMFCLGLGIDTELHGDIEYLYDIDPKGITVRRRSWTKDEEWKEVERHEFSDYRMLGGICMSSKQVEELKDGEIINIAPDGGLVCVHVDDDEINAYNCGEDLFEYGLEHVNNRERERLREMFPELSETLVSLDVPEE